MGFFLALLHYCTTALLHYCTIAPGTSFADTTWVSGAVSGEWTRDGNPYIVVDSTWVPEGERLRLDHGVEFLFRNDLGLHVFGSFESIGESDDSIFICSMDEAQRFRGIRLEGARSLVGFQFTSFTCIDTAIVLRENSAVWANNSRFESSMSIIEPFSEEVRQTWGWNLEFSRSQFSAPEFISIGLSTFNANNCIFRTGNGIEECVRGTSYPAIIDSCVFYGGVGIVFFGFGGGKISNCQFLRFNEENSIELRFTGLGVEVSHCYVEGRVIRTFSGDTDSLTLFHRNIVLGNIYSEGTSLSVRNCEIGGKLDIDGIQTGFIDNSTIKEGVIIRGVGNLEISNSIIGTPMQYPSLTIEGNREERIGMVEIDHSIFFFRRLYLHRMRGVRFDHCTVVTDSSSHWAIGMIRSEAEHVAENYSFTNSIFYSCSQQPNLFYTSYLESSPQFEYNCVYGYTNFRFRDTLSFEQLSESNIYSDPFLEITANSAILTSQSPCIDAGNPDAPLDPDGTRSDIGARFFDQGNSVSGFIPQPSSFILSAFPNPFNSMTTIQFVSPINREATRLAVFGLDGRLVATLLEGGINPALQGSGTLIWNASEVPAGSYFLRLEAGEVVKTERILLVR